MLASSWALWSGIQFINKQQAIAISNTDSTVTSSWQPGIQMVQQLERQTIVTWNLHNLAATTITYPVINSSQTCRVLVLNKPNHHKSCYNTKLQQTPQTIRTGQVCPMTAMYLFKIAEWELIYKWMDLSMTVSSLMLTPPNCCQCFKDTFDALAIMATQNAMKMTRTTMYLQFLLCFMIPFPPMWIVPSLDEYLPITAHQHPAQQSKNSSVKKGHTVEGSSQIINQNHVTTQKKTNHMSNLHSTCSKW